MKIALPLSILAVSMLAACATGPNSPATPTSQAPVPQQMPYYAGNGVVQTVSAVPTLASAGGTAAPAGDLKRLGIRMDDGRMVYVDTTSGDFPVGTRVRLGNDRIIEKQ